MSNVIISYQDYATTEEIDEHLRNSFEEGEPDENGEWDENQRYAASESITEWNWQCFVEDLGMLLKNYEECVIKLDGYNLDWRGNSGTAQMVISSERNSYARGISFLREIMSGTHVMYYEVSISDDHLKLWNDSNNKKPIPFSIRYCHHDATSSIDVMVYKPTPGEIMQRYADEINYVLDLSVDINENQIDVCIDDAKVEIKFDFNDDGHTFLLFINEVEECFHHFSSYEGDVGDYYELGIGDIIEIVRDKLNP